MDSITINNLLLGNELSNANKYDSCGNLFLQRKRNYEQSILSNCWNNYILPKKEVEFSILKKEANLEEFEKLLLIKNKNDYSKVSQGFAYNFVNNSKEQIINELLQNQNLNLKQKNYSCPSAIGNVNPINDNILNVANLGSKFNELEEKKSNELKEEINMNSNELKVMKNNKIVYANYIDSFTNLNYFKDKNKNKLNIIRRGKRGSKYRGVSRNGNQWQVLIMSKNSKSYVGLYPKEELAARIYDILAIKKKGVKARTNFQYNSEKVYKIFSSNIDIKAKNIDQIINDLLKED